MTTPDFRALCAELLQAWQFGDDIAGPMNRARAALKAEPEGESPSEKNLYDLAAEFNGDPVPAMRRALEVWGNPLQGAPAPAAPATSPAPEKGEGPTLTDVDELCAEFGFNYDEYQGETLEILQDMISASLARWGAPSAAAPAPGENLATPSSPEMGEGGELHPLWYLVEFLEGHSSFRRQAEPTDELAQMLSDSATLLQQQEAELAALRVATGPTYLDAIRLVQGCHDYSGGHTGAEGEAWHGAIDTVVSVLKRAAVGPWDSQTRAVFGVGVEAGDVAEPVAELDDQHREAVYQAVAEALGSGAYDCLRVWEAWGVGTMGPDDFVPVAEDSDRVAEIADAAIEAIRAIPAPQAGGVES